MNIIDLPIYRSDITNLLLMVYMLLVYLKACVKGYQVTAFKTIDYIVVVL